MIGRIYLTYLLSGLSVCAGAQMPGSKVATVSSSAKPGAIVRGSKGVLAIVLNVAPQFHINANKPNDKDLIPTTFTANHIPGILFGAPLFPHGASIHVSYEKLPMSVYEGKTTILVPFTVAKGAKLGKLALTGMVGYQGCNNTSCYPPVQAPTTSSITIK